ncbi:MAG TPA: DUF1254 domain-containing protein [Steroidobacteraceae bacterium]|nr:DUF1254 domain-containing protein [Steroidobacteraceae bacterium]
MEYEHLLLFCGVAVATWFLGVYYWPLLILRIYKRAILVKGFGEGPVPVNTLYTQPQKLFGEPIASQSAPGSKLKTTGVNHDTLLTVGWLDLKKGPQILRVPDMAGRYYSVQFNDPSKNANFAYVGKRTTGTDAGDYLIVRPGWKGAAPEGMPRISSPNNSVLVIGRVLVESDSDLPTAYALARQIELIPLAGR